MHQEIYKQFTIENKIILAKETIDILALKLRSEDDIKLILKLYIEKFASTSITHEEFMEFLSNFKRKENYFEVKNIKRSTLKLNMNFSNKN